MTRISKLNPELEACLHHYGRVDMWAIKHPLVMWIPYNGTDFEIERCNTMLNVKREQLYANEAKGKYDACIALHERPYRLDAAMQYRCHMNEQQWANTLRWIWVDSENIWQNVDTWEELLKETRPCGYVSHTMKADEILVYKCLPDEVTVYRGFTQEGTPKGLSWTLSREVAIKFAQRYVKKRGRVVQMTVPKSSVLAVYLSRNEMELVIPRAGHTNYVDHVFKNPYGDLHVNFK